MHKVENHCGLHSVNFLIYHIGMEVGIEGSWVISCAIALALIYKPMFNTDVSIYKSFLKDCLTFQLYVNDVFGTNDSYIIGKYGKLKETIFDEFSTSKISLTVRYKFNVTRSKYKGTGAGQSQKDRM
jgi:hypothetical protein